MPIECKRRRPPLLIPVPSWVSVAPVWLYRNDIAKVQRLPFALSFVPSLSIIVGITEIALQTKTMNTDIAAARVSAALLSMLLFATCHDGARLPESVRDEFDAFLECRILTHGFVRLRCAQCAHEKLVAFSCKRRGFPPPVG